MLGAVEALDYATARQERLNELLAEKAGDPRPGRPSRKTPEFLARVAEVYATALNNGRHPTRAVSESRELGGPFSRGYAGKLVHDARAIGLLGKTPPGKAGGTAPRRVNTTSTTSTNVAHIKEIDGARDHNEEATSTTSTTSTNVAHIKEIDGARDHNEEAQT
jgi:hypothetical protein